MLPFMSAVFKVPPQCPPLPLHTHLGVGSALPLVSTAAVEWRALSYPETPNLPMGGFTASLTHLALAELSICSPTPDLYSEPPPPPDFPASLCPGHHHPPHPLRQKGRRHPHPTLPPHPHIIIRHQFCQLDPCGASETLSPLPYPCCPSYS